MKELARLVNRSKKATSPKLEKRQTKKACKQLSSACLPEHLGLADVNNLIHKENNLHLNQDTQHDEKSNHRVSDSIMALVPKQGIKRKLARGSRSTKSKKLKRSDRNDMSEMESAMSTPADQSRASRMAVPFSSNSDAVDLCADNGQTKSVTLANDLHDVDVEDLDELPEGEVTTMFPADVDDDFAHLSEGMTPSQGSSKKEVGGFTVIGDLPIKGKVKVSRALPVWLAKPHVVKADIRTEKVELDAVKHLCPNMRKLLRRNGITHFFPVQQMIVPVVLDSVTSGWYVGRGGYRPSDICCSAPTGSGKTLAFVLPLVQALQNRVVPKVRALIVLPVRDLAVQVHKVFVAYTEHTTLRVALIVGQKNLAAEQASLVKSRPGGYDSLADIIVATPGRLVDHIQTTPGFDLSQLRFLVIDEADRMMEEIKQDWLASVEHAISRAHSERNPAAPITATNEARMQIPLQKLLFSATLSQNPEKLQQLNLFQPQLYTSVASSNTVGTVAHEGTGSTTDTTRLGSFEGKYTTPSTLAEYFIECSSDTKPLVLMHLIHALKFQHVLCFTNSVETTRRLYHLLDLTGGGIVVRQFSSAEHAYKRSRLIKQFESGKVHVLICSDAMARGMDVRNVQCVVSYDHPAFVKTYIHRVGRTARAGKAGTAFTLLEKKQVHHFKEMMKLAGKGKNVSELKVKKAELKPFVETYSTALSRLPDILKRSVGGQND